MESNEELRGHFANKSRKASASRVLAWRRWISALWGYSAFVSLLAVTLNAMAPKASFTSATLLSLAQGIGLVIGLYLIWSGKKVPTFLALIPAAAYLCLALGMGFLVAMPMVCVLAGALITVVLGLSLADSRPA